MNATTRTMSELEEEKHRSEVAWTINSIIRARQKGGASSAIQTYVSYQRLNKQERGNIDFTQDEAIRLEMLAHLERLPVAETAYCVDSCIGRIEQVGFTPPVSFGYGGSMGYDLKLTMPAKLAAVGLTQKSFASLCRKAYIRTGRAAVLQIQTTWQTGTKEIEGHVKALELASQKIKAPYEKFGTTRKKIDTMARGACLVRARGLVTEICEECHKKSVVDLVARLMQEVTTGRFPLGYLQVTPEEVARWLVTGQIADLEFGEKAQKLQLPADVLDSLQQLK